MENSGLTTSEIDSYLYCYPKFRGTFAADQIPALLPSEACICNTDTSDKAGQHWVLFYSPKKQSLEFFDSFANHPCNTLLFPRTFGTVVHSFENLSFNATSLQGYNTTVCGHYCIFVILQRWSGKALKEIVTKLSKVNNPDAFVKQQTRVKTCARLSNDQCCVAAKTWL
jgi:hypothetical protein